MHGTTPQRRGEVVAQLDLVRLAVAPGSFVDEELRHAHSDLLYAVRTRDDRAALVPVTLPLILPVLLHHGGNRWHAAPELATMLDGSPALLEATRPFQPHFRIVLDDLAALSLEELASRVATSLTRLVRLALWSSRSLDRVLDAAPLMGAIMATLDREERTRELLEQLHLYLLRTAPRDIDMEQFRTILFRMAGPQGREDVMNAGEQLIQQGIQQGLQRGEARGLRGAIVSVLAARGLGCGEASKAKLAACEDVALLARWHTRAVTASSEAEVFGDVGAGS